MKVAVIGGGSTYTPELINGLLARTATLPVTELVLMDIDPQRLEIVGGFAQRMVAVYYSRQAYSSESAGAAPFRVTLTDNQREAVRDASYVCTQLRVGQMEARRADAAAVGRGTRRAARTASAARAPGSRGSPAPRRSGCRPTA